MKAKKSRMNVPFRYLSAIFEMSRIGCSFSSHLYYKEVDTYIYEEQNLRNEITPDIIAIIFVLFTSGELLDSVCIWKPK